MFRAWNIVMFEAWNMIMHELAGSAFVFKSILEVPCVDQMDLEGEREKYFQTGSSVSTPNVGGNVMIPEGGTARPME